ncbi:GTP 3',8-cyclase MoaA [Helicovermis profundi]|uniref:GTP 3',8-cyclase n=1 Tax=Helicovermis profundi TaxID=3065157 RepID=A0AAU9E523_9FIRM|nr:GTP 3',8-cyclase MoaA [Clostridia bacterium S502]
MNDKYGRKINYLRISLTDLCNLRCKYCMPENGVGKIEHDSIMKIEEVIKIVKVMVKLGIDKIRLTGGEPLVKKGIIYLIEELNKIKEINEITMTTNGILLYEMAENLKRAGLSRVNISIDTFDKEKYFDVTRGGNLEKVLKGIEKCKEIGLTPIKLNTVLIGGFNDDEIDTFVNYTLENEVDVRFIELMPIGQASDWHKEKFISNQIVLDKFKELIPVKSEDISSPAKYYKLPVSKGKIGFINPVSCNFCSNCNRIRLTSDGKIKPCLHTNEEIDILTSLRRGEDIRSIIVNTILNKPKEHELNENGFIPIIRNMNSIGG